MTKGDFTLGTEGAYSLNIVVANVSSVNKFTQNITTPVVYVLFLRGFLTVFCQTIYIFFSSSFSFF